MAGDGAEPSGDQSNLQQIRINGVPVVTVLPPFCVHYANEYWRVLGIFGDSVSIMNGAGVGLHVPGSDLTAVQ